MWGRGEGLGFLGGGGGGTRVYIGVSNGGVNVQYPVRVGMGYCKNGNRCYIG